MKKLIAVMAFAGVLSVPSVILADASWYGSLRGGVQFGGGKDTQFADLGSRWGVKGSNELAEGLSANYRFETKLSTANAESSGGGDKGGPGGRLAYVGLSGGFGTLSLGQIWSASFNSTGVITDNSLFWGNPATSFRLGNALSYSNSVGNASLQIDAIMDGSRDTGSAVDQVEFGMTIGLGDIGKLAVAYVESKDTNINMKTLVHVPGKDGVDAVKGVPAKYYLNTTGAETPNIELQKITVLVPTNDLDDTDDGHQNFFFDADGAFQSDGEQQIVNRISYTVAGERVIDVGDISDGDTAVQAPVCGSNNVNCKEVEVYVHTQNPTLLTGGGFTRMGNILTISTPASEATTNDTTETYYIVVGDDQGNHATGLIEEGDDPNNFSMTDETKEVLAEHFVPDSARKVDDIKPGHKATHVAVEFGLGAVTAWAGYSKKENNGGGFKTEIEEEDDNVDSGTDGIIDTTAVNVASETKITHAGVRGSVGDDGINYYVAFQSVDTAGDKSNPYLINLNKSLGDGATVHLEHANDDDGKSGRTWVGLKVDF